MPRSHLKRRRIRKNNDGSFNEEDIKHNNESYRQNMIQDNPWMTQEIESRHVTYEHFLEAGIFYCRQKTNSY